MPEYHWEMSLQLRYVLSYHAAMRLILMAYAGDPASIYLIQWLTRGR